MITKATATPRCSFFLYCLAIVLLVLAFPIYQAIDTGGFVFYMNGIDEASYLSYPYAKILEQWRGLYRYSNTAVRWLQEIGLSGGWINLLFDSLGTVMILLLLPVVYSRCFALNQSDSRRCALVTFLAPLLVTPFNPLVAVLVNFRDSSPLLSVSALPLNPDHVFLRSPEPQMSLIVLCALCAGIGRRQALAWACVCLAPCFYTFVRVPVLLCALTSIAPKRLSLYVRFTVSFVIIALTSVVFSWYGVDPVLHRFFVQSHLPVIPLTAVVATGLWLSLRRKIPRHLSAMLVALVMSTWAAPNVQIVSGVMVSPTKYEEYWGAVVVAVLIALLVQYRARRPAVWPALFLIVFATWAGNGFKLNRDVYKRLQSPRETIVMLGQTPARVASSDLLLSVYLDMVYPRQEHTLFSFTKTYTLSSNHNYHEYLCGRRFVSTLPPEQSRLFEQQFARLDYGYAYRGVDEVITMRRRGLEESRIEGVSRRDSCPEEKPIFIDIGSSSNDCHRNPFDSRCGG